MSPRDRAESFDGLPDIMREIAEVAGLAAAMQLASTYGGTRVKIPRRIKRPTHWLACCIGLRAAEQLCRHFAVTDADGHGIGDFSVYIPQAGTGVIARAKRQLAQDLADGKLGVRAAARRAGLSERTAWAIKARMTADRQQDLFAVPEPQASAGRGAAPHPRTSR